MAYKKKEISLKTVLAKKHVLEETTTQMDTLNHCKLMAEVANHLAINKFSDVAVKLIKTISALAKTRGIDIQTIKYLQNITKALLSPEQNISIALRKIALGCDLTNSPISRKLSFFIKNLAGMLDGKISISASSINEFTKSWHKVSTLIKSQAQAKTHMSR